jgi:hypothetical protein
MSDITSQLRAIASRGRMDDADVQIVFDAADEIERLRREVNIVTTALSITERTPDAFELTALARKAEIERDAARADGDRLAKALRRTSLFSAEAAAQAKHAALAAHDALVTER